MISESHFLKLAYLLTVGDVCTPLLTDFDATQSTDVVWEKWSTELCGRKGLDPMEQIALVKRDGTIEGWVSYDMLKSDKILIDCMEMIKPDAILTSGTSLINAAKAFSNSSHPFFLILHEKWFKGWLPYKNLHTPPFRFCLLAMLITLEQTMLDTILLFPNESVKCLPERRLGKAGEVYNNRNYNYNDQGKPYDTKLLECTNFIDKFTILWKLMKKKIIKISFPLEDKKFCNIAEKLRNELAHPGLEEQSSKILYREMFSDFINWIEFVEFDLVSIQDYCYDEEGRKIHTL
jgi:hypothetical protein